MARCVLLAGEQSVQRASVGRWHNPDNQGLSVIRRPAADRLEKDLLERVGDAAFPCLGAKSALARGTLKVLACHSLCSTWDDLRIHRELLGWAIDYASQPEGLRSLAVVFEGPLDLDEAAFERAMWNRIQSFADKDHWLGLPYDARVSADPDDPHFSLSFGGEAFFVIGLHPRRPWCSTCTTSLKSCARKGVMKRCGSGLSSVIAIWPVRPIRCSPALAR